MAGRCADLSVELMALNSKNGEQPEGEIKSPSRMPDLLQAADDNDCRLVSSLLRSRNVNVHARDDLDRTALIIASVKGYEMCVKILLDFGEKGVSADVNAAAKGGITALHVTCFLGHSKVSSILLAQARMELLSATTSEEKFTALHLAAIKGNKSVMCDLWEAICSSKIYWEEVAELVNAKDCVGRTCLHYAAWEGHVGVVKELITWDVVDLNAADVDGYTPLHFAARNGHRDVVILLLNGNNVDPNCQADGNKKSKGMLSSLQSDVDWDLLPRPKLARYTFDENRSKLTPLHYAVEQNHEEVVTELVKDPGIKMHEENSESKTVFDVAMSEALQNTKVFWELLGRYAEKQEPWEKLRSHLSMKGRKHFIAQGQTALEKKVDNCGELLKIALHKSKHDDVFFLIKELEGQLETLNTKIRQNGKRGVSLLHHASFAGLDKLVEILAQIPGMDINAVDSDQQTPLHFAAVAGQANVARVLIKQETIRANAEDRFTRTALQVAVESDKRDVEKVLLEREEVRDYVNRLYRDRQVYVDAANAMMLGAALIASVTFAGVLQPPGGYVPYPDMEAAAPGSFETFASVDQHLSTRVFWVFNSLSFFSSIATVIAGAGAVLPTLDVFIGQDVRLVKRTLVATSTLMVFSVVFVLGAFAAAGYASLPPLQKYEKSMTITVFIGMLMCSGVVLWFLMRLYGIRPSWWRRLERRVRPLQPILESRHSARLLFSNPRPS